MKTDESSLPSTSDESYIQDNWAKCGVNDVLSDENVANRIDVESTEVLAKLAFERDIHFTYISTCNVFDGNKEVLYELDDFPLPLNDYGILSHSQFGTFNNFETWKEFEEERSPEYYFFFKFFQGFKTVECAELRMRQYSELLFQVVIPRQYSKLGGHFTLALHIPLPGWKVKLQISSEKRLW